jgi:hypothetical protein
MAMSSFQSDAQSPKFCRVVITFSLLVLSSILASHVRAEDVTLAWDEYVETGAGITGYRVYYGTDGQTFSNTGCDVIGTSCTVSGLAPGQTYYFVATSYNNTGESDYSAPPVSFTVPVTVSPYSIFASAGASGSIFPSGSIAVNGGDNQNFTISPSSDHHVDDVIVDGVSIGAVSSYTFNGVSGNHTIEARFAADENSYEITAAAGSGGSIFPSGTVAVSHGGRQNFTITPASGHQIADVKVDGVSMGTASTYTFNNVFSDYTISAFFARISVTHTITASAGSNGGISPSGIITVEEGANQSFAFAPAPGYQVADVRVNQVSVGAVSSYTFTNVQSDQTIELSFALLTPNQAPERPGLLLPEDDIDEIALTPLLEIAGFSDPDPGDIHGGTRWQIAADGRFDQLILDIVCDMQNTNNYLLSLQVPQGALKGLQRYYWRAMVKDGRSGDSQWSAWSASQSFTTAADVQADINANGVPDEFEPNLSDLDANGQNDNDQPLMRVLKTDTGEALLGLKAVEGVSEINRFSLIDPAVIFDLPRPALPYGLLSLNVNVDHIGGTARFELHLPEIPDASARWYKYDPINGWYVFPVQIIAGKYILEIVDGGFGDADGVANGIIVDPIGLADTTAAVTGVSDLDTGGSGNTLDELMNACFIGSTMQRTSTVSFGTHVQKIGAWYMLCGILILGLVGVLIDKAHRREECDRR